MSDTALTITHFSIARKVLAVADHKTILDRDVSFILPQPEAEGDTIGVDGLIIFRAAMIDNSLEWEYVAGETAVTDEAKKLELEQ